MNVLEDTIAGIPSTDDIIARYYNISITPDDADGERIGTSILPARPSNWRRTNHVQRQRPCRFKTHLMADVGTSGKRC